MTIYSPQHFGAVGDGVHDDTAAMVRMVRSAQFRAKSHRWFSRRVNAAFWVRWIISRSSNGDLRG
jgi:hypothetical protein